MKKPKYQKFLEKYQTHLLLLMIALICSLGLYLAIQATFQEFERVYEEYNHSQLKSIDRAVSDGNSAMLDPNVCAMSDVVCPGEVVVTGKASFYDYTLDSGWTSKGHMVCATRDFERHTKVKVTDMETGNSIVCEVTDFGPDESIHPDRVVDLSSTAFSQLAPLSQGIIHNVKVESI